MIRQKYINTIPSKIKAIYIFDTYNKEDTNNNENIAHSTIETKYIQIAIEYSDGKIDVDFFYDFYSFLNLCILNPEEYGLSFIEELVEANKGLLKIEDGIVRTIENDADEVCLLDIINNAVDKPAFNISGPLEHYPWHIFPSNIKRIVDVAQNILNTYHTSKICGLGQSPAWILKAMELIDPNKQYSYIPFSGHFFKPKHGNTITDVKFIQSNSSPTIEQIENYEKNILTNLFNPREIIDLYKSTAQKTLLLEWICTGSGLVSFLEILYEFAKKTLTTEDYALFQKSMTILVMDEDGESLALQTKLKFNGKEIIVEKLKVDYSGVMLAEYLANGINAGEFSDRLVPSYKWQNWEASGPDPIDLSTTHLCGILDKLRTCVNNLKAIDNGVIDSETHDNQEFSFDAETEPYILDGYLGLSHVASDDF